MRRPFPSSQRGRDAVLAVMAGVGGLIIGWFEVGAGERSPVAGLVVVAVAATLTLRRSRPMAVTAVAVFGRWLLMVLGGGVFALVPAVAIALFTLAGGRDRGRSLAAATTWAVVGAFVVSAADDEPFWWEFLSESAELLLPVAVADGARSRRDRMEDRVQARAEQRVQAERLRIARDLHDIVAHGLTVIAVQSGTAEHLLDRDPAQARQALAIINQTGRRTLEELRSMVGALRLSDDGPPRPTPADPDDLSAVIERARATGVDVELTVEGRFGAEAPAAVVTALHRILAEALTNVARHGASGRGQVSITHHPGAVKLVVANGLGRSSTTGPGPEPSAGVGLLGMGERAAAVGGTLTTETTDSEFRLVVDLPYGGRP